jgi:hypothetical protein
LIQDHRPSSLASWHRPPSACPAAVYYYEDTYRGYLTYPHFGTATSAF